MQNIPVSPIYLTRGGNVDETAGSLKYANEVGVYWSNNVTESTLYAYILSLGRSNIYPSGTYNGGIIDRYAGLTVRKAT